MEEIIFQQLKNELINGSVKKGHPFKYFGLSTVMEGQPQARTVVLRKTLPDLRTIFFTDKRSHKMAALAQNDKVTALFYHPKKLLQLQILGRAAPITDSVRLAELWNGVPPKARKDYTTFQPPGTPLSTTGEIKYLEEGHHFAALEIIPHTIAYLQLQRPQHQRLVFTRIGQEWKGTLLVP
ncbi:MAG: pyridoxamine 5'-phosphate oxidase family protein [Bacteroidota bacterium]